jgi:hypothetical protein
MVTVHFSVVAKQSMATFAPASNRWQQVLMPCTARCLVLLLEEGIKGLAKRIHNEADLAQPAITKPG